MVKNPLNPYPYSILCDFVAWWEPKSTWYELLNFGNTQFTRKDGKVEVRRWRHKKFNHERLKKHEKVVDRWKVALMVQNIHALLGNLAS